MEHRVWDGELRFNNRPQEKLKKRSLLLTGPRENTWPWARVEVKAKKDKQMETKSGHMLLLGSVGRVLGGSWANSN